MDTETVGFIVAFGTVAFFFGLLFYAMRRVSFGQPPGEGYAPGWQVRCPKCGLTVDAGKAGLTIVKARGWGLRNWGRCSDCDAGRWLIVERVPDPAPSRDHESV